MRRSSIPYQTLVSSVLHKYVSGGLHDVLANKRVKNDAQKTRAFHHVVRSNKNEYIRFKNAKPNSPDTYHNNKYSGSRSIIVIL